MNDLVGGWIRRGSPLVNILYDLGHKCANKKTELRQEDFDAYNIKYRDWRIRSNAEVFNPSADTIDAISVVMIQYNHPKFPVIFFLLMLSPPRHRHGGPRNLVVRRQDCANESVYYNNMYCIQCQR